MASSPGSDCCARGFKHEGKPTGTLDSAWTRTSLGDVEVYISKPPSGVKDLRHGILFLSDIIGHSSANSQLLADGFAARGYTVVLPDMFWGDPVNLAAYEAGKVVVHPNWYQGDYSPRKIAHTPESVDPIIEKSIAKMRDELKLDKVAAVGYCFGAKEVVRFLGGHPSGQHLDAGYVAHPSWVGVDELEQVKRPLSIAASEDDHIFSQEKRHKSEDVLIKTGVPWQINLYGSVSHGFAVRGDLSNRRLRFAMDRAFQQAVDWFEEWLKD